MEPYIPDKLPLRCIDCNKLLPLVGKASTMIGRYDGMLQSIINPVVMLSPLTNEEAVLSSRIEGTQATVDEVLEHEAGMVNPRSNHEDIKEIINYRKALRLAQQTLANNSISMHLIRELHRILLNSVRGENKNPGEVRKDQNWIGTRGSTIEHASFIPPNPMQLPCYLEQWEQYISGNDIDILIQAGVLHAQFELLHPFKDGNGRLGRILIPLFLYQKRAISQPMFYLSSYLEANRDEYYRRLQGISSDGQWNEWLIFFLSAISEQARINCGKVTEILKLYEQMKQQIHEVTHSQYVIQILDTIFNRPIFRTPDFIKEMRIPKQTAVYLLSLLRNADIVKEIQEGRGRKASVYCFPQLLNITEGKKIF